MDRPKVYIAGALTGLDPPEVERFKAMYEDIGRACEELGLAPYLPHARPIRYGTPQSPHAKSISPTMIRSLPQPSS